MSGKNSSKRLPCDNSKDRRSKCGVLVKRSREENDVGRKPPAEASKTPPRPRLLSRRHRMTWAQMKSPSRLMPNKAHRANRTLCPPLQKAPSKDTSSNLYLDSRLQSLGELSEPRVCSRLLPKEKSSRPLAWVAARALQTTSLLFRCSICR